jgi:protein phosphatase
MSEPMRLEMSERTDVGMIRRQNEDGVYTAPALGLVILADGMGGHSAGEVASSLAISVVAGEFRQWLESGRKGALRSTPLERGSAVLVDAIEKANETIYSLSKKQSSYAGMGTTLVAAWFAENTVTVAHAGDSRLYRLRDGRFEQLTRDHSMLQEQIDAGILSPADARESLVRNLITRAVGIASELEVEVQQYEVEDDDLYLLCSDGMTDMAEDEEIGQLLKNQPDLEKATVSLVELANRLGGRDNTSVILVRTLAPLAAARTSWLAQMAGRLGLRG